MRMHPGTHLAAVVLAAALPAVPALAMCAVTDGPRLYEGVVVGCRALGEPLREAGAGDGSRHEGEGVLLTFAPRRYRQLNLEPIGSEGFALGPWQELTDEECQAARQEYLLAVPGARCARKPAESEVLLLELQTCCDTMPPQDAACILGVPSLVAPPAELVELLEP
jgi:hypothetical protein